MISFTHLHVHSQYSILDGAAAVGDLINKAKKEGMNSLALTDHGTMFGIKEFHELCKKSGIKPILGVETYVASRGIQFKDKSDQCFQFKPVPINCPINPLSIKTVPVQ